MYKGPVRRSLYRLSVVFCLLPVLFAACSSSGVGATSVKASNDKQIFTYPLDGYANISTFDPALSTDIASITAIDTVFTGLVQLDDKLVVRPQLAQSWQQSADGLTWTFHLRHNLKFSDGTPLTSKDVAYSIVRALRPAMKSVVAPIYLGLIKDSDKLNTGKIKTIIGDSVLIPDSNTLIILANKKAAYFLQALTYSSSYVVEKKLVNKYGVNFTNHLDEGGGAGPFKVQKFDNNTGITLVPNANYYGPKPQLSKLIIPFYKDVATGYKAYETGQVDYALVPTADLENARSRTAEFRKVPQLDIYYYGMNFLTKPFDNIHIRQAFDLALNKTEIAHAIWKDLYTPTNHIVPQGMPGYNPNLTAPDGNISTAGNGAKAKQLFQQGLKEEGYSSVSMFPSITLHYPSGSRDTDNEISFVTQTWQSVLGVTIKPDRIDFTKLVDDINSNPDNPNGMQMWYINWIADYPDPQDWTTLQFDKDLPNNNTNFGQNASSDIVAQQNVQKALEEADINNTPARMNAYNQMEQQLVNDVAWLPTTQVNTALMLKPYVKGLTFNAELEIPPNDWGSVYIAAH